MATRPVITGAPTRAPSPATNVIRLPTAPRRMVQQNHNRAARAARADLPQFPGQYIFPGERAMLGIARDLVEVRKTLTPEMELVSAILGTLDDAARMKVAAALAPGVVMKRRSAVQAAAVLRANRMTHGERNDLYHALVRILRDGR